MKDSTTGKNPTNAQSNIVDTFSGLPWRGLAVLGTMVYVYLSILGLMYMRSLFRQFGINIMDFVEANDFLIASLKNPRKLQLALLYVLVALVYVGLYYMERALPPPWDARVPSSRVWQLMYLALIVLLLGAASYRSITSASSDGQVDGAAIKSGERQEIGLELASSGEGGIPSCFSGGLFLIGTTEKFAFIYDKPNNYTHVVPISNILQIHYLSKASTWACPGPRPMSILWEIDVPEGKTRAIFTRDVLMDQSCTDCKLGELQTATMLRPERQGCQQAAWDPGSEWTYCHVEVLDGDLAGTDGWVNASDIGTR